MRKNKLDIYFGRFLSLSWVPVFLVFVFALVIFGILTRGQIFSPQIIDVWLKTAPILGIISIGVTVLMISGEFDLSVGSVLALSAMIMVWSYEIIGLNVALSLILAFTVSLLTSLFHSIIVVKLKVPSFIVTLGGMLLWRSLVLVVIGGHPISFTIRDTNPIFNYLLIGNVFGVPIHFIWFLVVVIIFWILMSYHPFGNHIYATGGNIEAAKRRGINTDKVKIICFMIVGALVSFTSIMQAARTLGAHTQMGLGLELRAIAAAVIGGTSLFGGRGTILGTFFAVMLFSVLESGLLLIHAPGEALDAFIGGLLVAVIIIKRFVEKQYSRM